MARLSKSQAVGFFIAGAAVGAIAALMYAPKTGLQMRRDVRKFSKRTAERLDDLQCDIREQAMGVLDNAKRYVEDGRSLIERVVG